MKFNSKQLLFEQFFDIISHFCSIQPWRAYFLISVYNSIVHDHLCDTWLPTFETLSFFAYEKGHFCRSADQGGQLANQGGQLANQGDQLANEDGQFAVCLSFLQSDVKLSRFY